jgi:hypothetical protein
MKSKLYCNAVRRASMTARFLTAATVTAALVARCGGAGGLPDGGSLAGLDAGEDAGIDAGEDAGVDAGIDAGEDAGIDAGPGGGTTPGCTVTISGGFSETANCSVTAFTTLSTGGSTVVIDVQGIKLADGTFDHAGEMIFGTNRALSQMIFTTVTPNPDQISMDTIWVADGNVWEQIFISDADGGHADKMGTWTLNLTSITLSSTVDGAQFFTVHGTGVAQLLGGLNPQVTFSATF